MRRITPLFACLLLLLLAAGQALAAGPLPAGFDAEAFRRHFAAGLAVRPNAPPLTEQNVRVEAAEKAASFAGTDIYVVRGELKPAEGQAQPFIMFVSADGQFYISDIVDMRQGRSILKDARERMRAEEVKGLGHTVLKSKGKAVVVYVSDPFCPYCRSAYAYLLEKKASLAELRLAHYPLPSHPGADIACSLMAWAADKAPKRLADFVRFAYTDLPVPQPQDRSQESLRQAWEEVAGSFLRQFPELKALGKDAAAIVAALNGSRYAREVQADMAKAAALDISGTPVIFVGGARVDGFDEQRLEGLLR